MNRAADFVPNARNCTKGVGTCPQMSDRAKVLERVTLLCERVVGSRPNELERIRSKFGRLSLGRGSNDFALDDHAGTGGGRLDVGSVVGQVIRNDDLEVLEARAVI